MRDMSHLPARIRALRKSNGLTIERLAQVAGLSVATVNRLEAGKHEPTVSTLDAIAPALGTTTAELLAEPAAQS